MPEYTRKDFFLNSHYFFRLIFSQLVLEILGSLISVVSKLIKNVLPATYHFDLSPKYLSRVVQNFTFLLFFGPCTLNLVLSIFQFTAKHSRSLEFGYHEKSYGCGTLKPKNTNRFIQETKYH